MNSTLQEDASKTLPEVPVSSKNACNDDGCDTRSCASQDEKCEEESDEDAGQTCDDYEMSLTELMYGASSYHAIAKPVTLTMILAASAAVFINTEESLLRGEQELAEAYQVWKVDDAGGENGTGMTLARSFGNAAVMVSVLCAMTFLIVILYKNRFMKCLIGYMVFTSASLLGLMGSVMFEIAIEKYRIPIDAITYYFCLWNFAAVGTVAIFWQLGVPSFVTQGYLVATSVILAWHLSHFDAWTAWTLLVMLALYDLCAVLTPCGPLKALVNAMQEEDAPEMPGLLYEAQLEGGHAGRRDAGGVVSSRNGVGRRSSGDDAGENTFAPTDSPATGPQPGDASMQHSSPASDRPSTRIETCSGSVESFGEDPLVSRPRIVKIPFAIAKIYRLPLVAPPPTHSDPDRTSHNPKGRKFRKRSSNVDPSSLLSESHEVENAQPFTYGNAYTPQQLLTDVQAQLPANGGRIEEMANMNREQRYAVYDRNGELKRVLVVNHKGKVLELLEEEDDDSIDSDDEDTGKFSNSIRLGLGDFIFFSVMVAKAAMYSFTTFAACMLVILAGLGVTLVLLAVYHHALPALPVSIFLGVFFYLLTRLSIEPWIQDVMKVPLYV